MFNRLKLWKNKESILNCFRRKDSFLFNFLFVAFIFCDIACLSASGEALPGEVTFHNVGQGNCTVIKSPRRQVLVVDAGSSNTVGVEGIPERGKYEVLADKIFTSIKDDLEASKWLWFVVSHPDKDHLNLVTKIIESAREVFGASLNLGVLLGGPQKDKYKKEDSKKLVSFLENETIPHFYGGEHYVLERRGIFYVSRHKSSPILAGWEGRLDFLSLDADTNKVLGVQMRLKTGKRKGAGSDTVVDLSMAGSSRSSVSLALDKKEIEDDDTNKLSIVMKISVGGFSIMLTGDKTKTETKAIIARFAKEGQLDALKSDILLATHHGSWDDYVPEWVQHVDPRYVVFSAGRSYDHPGSRTVDGYIAKAGNLASHPWHFVQFQGDFINYLSSSGSAVGAGSSAGPSSSLVVKSIAREAPSIIEKARGYVHAVTNKAIFVTANQGDISFLQDGSVRISGLTHADLSTFPTDLVHRFLGGPTLLDGTRVEIEELNFDGETSLVPLLPALETLPSLDDLQKLSVKSLGLTDADVDGMCSLISGRTDVTNLDLTGNGFSEGSKEKIREAWGHRGLRL